MPLEKSYISTPDENGGCENGEKDRVKAEKWLESNDEQSWRKWIEEIFSVEARDNEETARSWGLHEITDDTFNAMKIPLQRGVRPTQDEY